MLRPPLWPLRRLCNRGTYLNGRSLTTLGIRREDPARVWERRVPLTPEAVGSLLSTSKQGDLEVEVESCRRRCFPDDLYQQVRIRPALYISRSGLMDGLGRGQDRTRALGQDGCGDWYQRGARGGGAKAQAQGQWESADMDDVFAHAQRAGTSSSVSKAQSG